MAIHRGTGGAGDATTDITIGEVTAQALSASNSKTAAASSASSASTSATAAASSASGASTSASTATTKASAATSSASAAATSATAAASSATAAASSASSASSTLSTSALKANNLSDLANAVTARSNLGLVIGTNVQAYDAQLADVAGLAVTDGSVIIGNGSNFIVEGGATARTSLGLGSASVLATGIADTNVPKFTSGVADDDFLRINGALVEGRSAAEVLSDIGAQPVDAQLTDVAGLAVTNGGFIVGDGSNFVLETGATTRTSLGLGTTAVLDTGIANTNIPKFTSGVADDDFLRINGALVEGRSAAELLSDIGAQPVDAQLTDVAGLAVTNSGFIVGDGSNFVLETGATVRTSLGLGSAALLDTGIANTNVPKFTSGVADDDFLRVAGAVVEGRSAAEVLSDIGAQPVDAQLTDVAGLAVTNSGFIVGDGSNFVLETGATVRTSLGLGTIATDAQGDYIAKTAATGSGQLPAGTTAQRDGTPAAGMIRYNSTTTGFEGYSDAWGSLGGATATILQVVSATITAPLSSTSTSYVDTGITLAITPADDSNKVLVLISAAVGHQDNNGCLLQLLRASTSIGGGVAAGSNQIAGVVATIRNTIYSSQPYFIQSLDSPATASAVTYKLQGLTTGSGQPFTINRTVNGTNVKYNSQPASTITLIEIAA